MNRKLKQLAAREKGVEEYNKCLIELRACRNKERELELMEELERWDDKLEELCKPLAFEDNGEEVQTEMMNVAQYSDEWCKTKTGTFRALYVCMQDWGGQWPACGTLMPSQAWTRRFEDPTSSKQRWYCVCCRVWHAGRVPLQWCLHIHAL